MVPDVIVEMLVNSAEASLDSDPERRETQQRFRELEKRRLAYPFLAAWRLTIEVQLKSTIDSVNSVLPGGPLAGRAKKEMSRHDVAYLWSYLTTRQLPTLSNELKPLLPRLHLSGPTPGFDFTVTEADEATIQNLVRIDPDGQTLRYDSSLDGKRNLAHTPSIDISEMHRQLSDVYAWLSDISGVALSVRIVRECESEIEAIEAHLENGRTSAAKPSRQTPEESEPGRE
ncbi:hypothetical protein GCM10009613_54890 [Pseudonocardia kongjuensis]|uniref:DUF4393 domain-containing protein n=1 Tax=Pseudonocardia kongjuensis TaxID=102227 RepID=A0ABN1Y8M5_9PSEU